MAINFRNIKPHNGDQKAAFEEMVCLLAMLEKTDDRIEFTRKGRGADGGVECYWKTKNGEEICWQAKYFTDNIRDTELSEIDKSIKTAIAKHPQMKEYIVCTAVNLKDSRQVNRNGSTQKTEKVKWDSKVAEWIVEAQNNNINLKITYWGETELLQRLLIDDKDHNGIKNYFFDITKLSFEKLNEIMLLSKKTLAGRYSQEDDIPLEIDSVFDALSGSKSWYESISDSLSPNLLEYFSDNEVEKYNDLKKYNDQIKNIKHLLEEPIDTLARANEIIEICDSLEYSLVFKFELDGIYYAIKREHNSNNDLDLLKEIYEKKRIITRTLSKYSSVLSSDEYLSYSKKVVLIKGEAGIGKSHSLCANSIRLIKQETPVLFLLGQHYTGGFPMEFIKKNLDLSDCSNADVLCAMNTMGLLYQCRFVIIIDAINEGAYRSEWINQIDNFINTVKEYSYISLVISCKSSFVCYSISESLTSDSIQIINHTGFTNIEFDAINTYFSRRSIIVSSLPIMTPEFSNPLFLKTCCEAIIAKGLHSFPKGIQGYITIFDFYLEALNDKLCRQLHREKQPILYCFIEKFIEALFPTSYYTGIEIQRAEKIAEDILGNKCDLNYLFDNGILSAENHISDSGRKNTYVRFTFERYTEMFVAKALITKCNSIDDVSNLCNKGFNGEQIISFKYYGLVSAIAIIVAEKFNCELIDCISEDNIHTRESFIEMMFTSNIIMRSSKGITSRSIDLLNEAKEDSLEILVNLALEPKHPWNILFLESYLFKMSMPERDSFWSIDIAADYVKLGFSLSASQILNWIRKLDLKSIDKERIELISYLLTWFTSTNNCRLRAISTKLLARVFYYYPDLIISNLNKYKDVNDMYILESIYAAAYGATVYLRDRVQLLKISECIYNIQFKDYCPTVDALVREYASLIIIYCQKQNAINNCVIIDRCKPPFHSDWLEPNQSFREIINCSKNKTVYHSLVSSIGDFRRYILNSVDQWSITPINEDKIWTYDYYNQELRKATSADIIQLLDELRDLEEENKKSFSEAFEEYINGLNRTSEKDNSSINNDYVVENNINPSDTLGTYVNSDEKDDFDYDNLFFHKKDDDTSEKIEKIKNKIISKLNQNEKALFDIIINHSLDQPVRFNPEIAIAFIYKKIYEYGYLDEWFESYDRGRSDLDYYNPNKVERIGKKYQWIAFYELIARLSDNFKWLSREFDDLIDDSFYSLMQINRRKFEATLWSDIIFQNPKTKHKDNIDFWILSQINYSSYANITMKDWVCDKSIVPKFEIMVEQSYDNKKWIILHGFSSNIQNYNDYDTEIWCRVDGLVVKKDQIDEFINIIKNNSLEDRSDFEGVCLTDELYYGEYCWHDYLNLLERTRSENQWKVEKYEQNIHIPIYEYEWENSIGDYSLNQTISSFIPSPLLVNDLELSNSPMQIGKWFNKNDEIVFMQLNFFDSNNDYAMIEYNRFKKWLDDNDSALVWIIGGEKQVFRSKYNGLVKRTVFNCILTEEHGKIVRRHFKFSEPQLYNTVDDDLTEMN